MTRLLQPLFALFASTDDTKLRQMVEYFREENKILRAKLPKTVTLTAHQKNRLIKLGFAVGSASKHLVSIVSYRTFCRWAVAGPPLAKTRRAGPQAGVPAHRTADPRTDRPARWVCARRITLLGTERE